MWVFENAHFNTVEIIKCNLCLSVALTSNTNSMNIKIDCSLQILLRMFPCFQKCLYEKCCSKSSLTCVQALTFNFVQLDHCKTTQINIFENTSTFSLDFANYVLLIFLSNLHFKLKLIVSKFNVGWKFFILQCKLNKNLNLY